MALSYFTRELLSPESTQHVRNVLSQGSWSKSDKELVEYYPGYQNNSEMVPSAHRQEIAQIVMTAISADQKFHDLVFPAQSTAVIVSKTEVGEGFKIHQDNVGVGDFSTTVFLSDPDTYGGGELAIWYEGEVQKFKLPAGHAITYSTGAPHGVLPVTSGTRQVAVFWTTSSIRDPRHREILSGLRRLRRMLPVTHTYSFDEITNDPEFLLLGLENKYIRYFL